MSIQTSRLAPSIAGLMLGTALAGCGSTTLVEDVRKPPMRASLSEGESIVVLNQYQRAALETDSDFVECIEESLQDGDRSVSVVPRQEFVDGMYPYFEASTAPTSVQSVANVVQDPAARKRMEELNVRYLVWVNGNTETVDRNGSFSCTIGPGGGGCFGWASWTNQGAYNAKIWDLKDRIEAGTFDVSSTGTSHLVGLILPIPMLADVEGEACEAVAQRVQLAVNGGPPPRLSQQQTSQQQANQMQSSQ